MGRLKVEGYEFDFPNAKELYKFDEQDSAMPHFHGLSHCMKAVDVVVELADAYLFIEIKRFDEASVLNEKSEQRTGEPLNWLVEVLTRKYRDTFIYRYCQDKVDKPIKYICLVDKFDGKLLPQLRKHLLTNIPVGQQLQAQWEKALLEKNNLFVLNETTWNKSKLSEIGTCKYVGLQSQNRKQENRIKG